MIGTLLVVMAALFVGGFVVGLVVTVVRAWREGSR